MISPLHFAPPICPDPPSHQLNTNFRINFHRFCASWAARHASRSYVWSRVGRRERVKTRTFQWLDGAARRGPTGAVARFSTTRKRPWRTHCAV
ncbi:hypothetical protein J6590_037327 [Homalodisca vitripennis]|nr:hypothetical protein J6590_037327 [Homalodisca vitripennis]